MQPVIGRGPKMQDGQVRPMPVERKARCAVADIAHHDHGEVGCLGFHARRATLLGVVVQPGADGLLVQVGRVGNVDKVFLGATPVGLPFLFIGDVQLRVSAQRFGQLWFRHLVTERIRGGVHPDRAADDPRRQRGGENLFQRRVVEVIQWCCQAAPGAVTSPAVVAAAQAAFGRHHPEGQAAAAMRATVAQRRATGHRYP